jgi:hypothetical protein
METAWIQVFVLTLTQCLAPAGKMVCQEETVEYYFSSEDDCSRALVQMVDLAARADNILVDRQRSDCRPGVKQAQVFASGDEARSSMTGGANVLLIDDEVPPANFMQSAHNDRLKDLQACDATDGVAPCKIGDIIIEAASESPSSQVWQQQK